VNEFEPDPRYQQYWRHFRTGKFWDAHEVLEDLWRESTGTDRTFYQGLIQVAAALHHLGEGNMHGADRLSRAAREKLEPLGTQYQGVQIESLMMGLTICLEDARRSLDGDGRITDRRRRIPRVDLAYGLDPASCSD
jgi:predicted metal-dependent hydrolase